MDQPLSFRRQPGLHRFKKERKKQQITTFHLVELPRFLSEPRAWFSLPCLVSHGLQGLLSEANSTGNVLRSHCQPSDLIHRMRFLFPDLHLLLPIVVLSFLSFEIHPEAQPCLFCVLSSPSKGGCTSQLYRQDKWCLFVLPHSHPDMSCQKSQVPEPVTTARIRNMSCLVGGPGKGAIQRGSLLSKETIAARQAHGLLLPKQRMAIFPVKHCNMRSRGERMGRQYIACQPYIFSMCIGVWCACVRPSVCRYICVQVNMHMYTYVQKPQIGFRSHPQLLSTLFFETKSLC